MPCARRRLASSQRIPTQKGRGGREEEDGKRGRGFNSISAARPHPSPPLPSLPDRVIPLASEPRGASQLTEQHHSYSCSVLDRGEGNPPRRADTVHYGVVLSSARQGTAGHGRARQGGRAFRSTVWQAACGGAERARELAVAPQPRPSTASPRSWLMAVCGCSCTGTGRSRVGWPGGSWTDRAVRS